VAGTAKKRFGELAPKTSGRHEVMPATRHEVATRCSHFRLRSTSAPHSIRIHAPTRPNSPPDPTRNNQRLSVGMLASPDKYALAPSQAPSAAHGPNSTVPAKMLPSSATRTPGRSTIVARGALIESCLTSKSLDPHIPAILRLGLHIALPLRQKEALCVRRVRGRTDQTEGNSLAAYHRTGRRLSAGLRTPEAPRPSTCV
jgi:hypothetical protein